MKKSLISMAFVILTMIIFTAINFDNLNSWSKPTIQDVAVSVIFLMIWLAVGILSGYKGVIASIILTTVIYIFPIGLAVYSLIYGDLGFGYIILAYLFPYTAPIYGVIYYLSDNSFSIGLPYCLIIFGYVVGYILRSVAGKTVKVTVG